MAKIHVSIVIETDDSKLIDNAKRYAREHLDNIEEVGFVTGLLTRAGLFGSLARDESVDPLYVQVMKVCEAQ